MKQLAAEQEEFLSKNKTKTKKEDCTYYIEQNKQLVKGLLEIRNTIDPQPTSFTGISSSLIFASYIDTLPKKISSKDNKILNKIDSILLKIRNDSIKQKQINKTKN